MKIHYHNLNSSVRYLVYLIGRDLSQYSIFLLAATRVFILYWPDLYKRIFGRKFLLIWILYADILLAGLALLIHNNGHLSTSILYITMELGLLFGTYTCAFLVLVQIRKMKKELDNCHKSGNISNLHISYLICTTQVARKGVLKYKSEEPRFCREIGDRRQLS